MKKLIIGIVLILTICLPSFAELSNVGMEVFSEKGLFGLKDKNGNITVNPEYRKLIRLGNSTWIVQKRTKYGIIDSFGNILIEPKYRQADRMMLKYVKFGNDFKFGVYDEKGQIFIPPEYSSINMLFGGMFLTCKNYKYGIIDKNGKVLLENKFDEIYMPKPYVMRIQYNGEWYEIEQVNAGEFNPPEDIQNIKEDSNFKVTTFITDPVVASGYSAVTFTDYILKLLSSISPAHEETIDELMFSQGADTVSIFMRLTWLPKYPFTYLKNYYHTVRTPNNGPLSSFKDKLKQKMN